MALNLPLARVKITVAPQNRELSVYQACWEVHANIPPIYQDLCDIRAQALDLLAAFFDTAQKVLAFGVCFIATR
jgi:hypothetical protein